MSLLLIIGTGCDLTPPTDSPGIDPIQNDMDLRLSFTGMPTGSELSDKKSKSGDEISPYGCFLNAYQPDESEPYRYWSVYLHYPERIVDEAGDRKAVYKYRLKEDSEKVYLLANCVIPATQNAANLVDRLLRESLSEYESSSTVAKSNHAPQPVNTTNDWCSQPNDEGFNCTPGTCWRDAGMELCEDPEGNIFMPEAEVVAEIEECIGDNCGGGAPLPWPPPPPSEDPSEPDPWEPNPGGGSSTPCATCEPGDDPNENDEQLCPLGQIDDGFGNCIEEEPEDCTGVQGGKAYLDSCGNCVGGTSGFQSCCASFDAIMTTVFNSEGGYSDREADKGGKTNKGISWKIWQVHAETTLGISPTVSNLQALTEEQAKSIYHAEFWQRSRVSNFLDGDLARMFFDFYINTNVGATESIQKALLKFGYPIAVDGAMGPQTEGFINMAIIDGHLIELHNSFKDEMKDYYYDKANDPEDPLQKENEDGWINRVNKFEDKTEEETFNLHCDV